MTEPTHHSAPKATDASLGAEAQALMHALESVFSSYQQRWLAHINLAGKEWQLSKQAVSMILLLTLFMSAVMSCLWILCNLALGSVLYQLGWPLYALSLSLITLNIALLLVLWKAINVLTNKVGFSRSVAALSEK